MGVSNYNGTKVRKKVGRIRLEVLMGQNKTKVLNIDLFKNEI